METDNKFGDESVSQIFSRTVQGALEQQAKNYEKALEQQSKNYEKALEPLVNQLGNLTDNVNGLTVQMAVMIEQQKHAHTSPCQNFQEFRNEQREENKALHARISQHKDEDHRNDKKERNASYGTLINTITAIAAIAAVVVSLVAIFH